MINIKNKSKQKGFTLIELLVVVAIIGLLLSIISVGFGRSRMKSRDAKRMTDISQIRSGLDLHYNHGSGYPDLASWNSGNIVCNGERIMTTPKDPLLQVNYTYLTQGQTDGCGGVVWQNYYVEFTTEAETDLGAAGTYYLSPAGITLTPPF